MGAQQLRVREDGAQDLQRRLRAGRRRLVVEEIVQIEGIDRFYGVGVVGMDLEAVEVADDEERGAFQIFAVLLYLSISGLEVLVLPLVLPCEVAPLPDVGPAALTARLVSALLEGVEAAVGIGGCWRWLTEHGAEVEEMLLGGAALGERAALPARDERGDIET